MKGDYLRAVLGGLVPIACPARGAAPRWGGGMSADMNMESDSQATAAATPTGR